MANNNLTEAYKNIFLPLINGNANLHQKNSIYLDENDIELFKKLELKSRGNIVHGFSYANVAHGDDNYLILSNIIFDESKNIEFDKNLIEYVEDYKKSFFVYLASKDVLKIKTSKKEIFLSNILEKEKEEKYFEYIQNTGIRRHKYNDIYEYYDDFSIFKIPSQSIFNSSDDIYKTILYLITIHLDLKFLPYSEKTIQAFQDVALSSANKIPYKYVCEAFIASQFKYAYKDLYRCIENLYGLEIIKKLLSVVSLECNLEKLREELENVLSWRPNELSSFTEIMQSINADLLNKISSVLCSYERDTSWLTDEKLKEVKLEEVKKLTNLQKSSRKKNIESLFKRIRIRICDASVETKKKENIEENIEELQTNIEKIDKEILRKKALFCANRLYSLRNSLVHYRKALESKKIEYTDTTMQEIIILMLNLIDELYGRNENA